MMDLTKNAIKALHTETYATPELATPVIQIINLKPMDTSSGMRYRMVISDGEFFMQAMLATSLNYMVETKQVFKNSIIKLHKISSNSLQGRKVMILFQFDVLVAEGIEKIGSPVAVDVVSTTPSVNTTATAPAPTVTQPYLQQNQNQNPTRVEPRVETQQPRSNPQLDASLFNIKGLNPYQERWTIKARVSFKSEVKTWHNARSQGKLFSVNFLDNSGEIKATIFNDQVDRLYNLLEEGKVYYVSRAKISMARKQFSTLDNEYELSLENGTEIELCNDDHAVPQVRFNFVKIADIENIEKGTNIDVIGVLKEDMGVQEIMTKATGKLSKKRELLIVDDTQKQIRVTLWGNTAENFSSSGSPVLAFKGCRVNDFQGKTLSLSQPGILKMDPDLSESRVLRQWFDKNDTTTSYSVFANQTGTGNGEYKPKEKLTLQQARTDNLGGTDVADYYSSKVTISYLKSDNPAYPACPDCKKKLSNEGSGWRCEKCSKMHASPDWRYVLTVNLADATAQVYANTFDEVGSVILNTSANHVMELKDSNTEEYQKVFKNALYKVYNVKIRAKTETYNDSARIKHTLIEAVPIDYVKDARLMVDSIEKLIH